jgi:hypothetical protein
MQGLKLWTLLAFFKCSHLPIRTLSKLQLLGMDAAFWGSIWRCTFLSDTMAASIASPDRLVPQTTVILEDDASHDRMDIQGLVGFPLVHSQSISWLKLIR